MSEISEEAKAILKAAAESDGCISHMRSGEGGVAIAVGRRDLIPEERTHRTVACWLGGLKDLLDAGYITETSKGEYEVTREGYERHDRERPEQEPERMIDV